MNLIILYGPPASGKLTVGKALAKLIGYPLLHNHLVVDLAIQFFPFGTPGFNTIARTIRRTIIDAAIKERLPGLIMTYVWASNNHSDNSFILRLAKIARLQRSRVVFVGLRCPEPILLRRVGNSDRRAYGKLHSATKLKKVLARWETQNLKHRPLRKILTIDTARTKPKQAASKIVKYIHLPKNKRAL